MNTYFIKATSLLAGTIIGAGIFSLPFIFRIVGVGAGVVYLAFFTICYFSVHLMYVKVLEANSEGHEFFYFAKKYLPWGMRSVASLSIFLELFFVLATYLILAPVFGNIIFTAPPLFFLAGFWLLGSVFIFVRPKWLGLAEVLGILGILGIIAMILRLSLSHVFQAPLFETLDWGAFFLPFGPLLFSLGGRPALSAVVSQYKKAKSVGREFKLRNAVLWGTVIPAVVYLLFIVGVLKINPFVGPETLNSLGSLSPLVLSLLGVLGLIALWTSYFIVGISARNILHSDLKHSRILSAIIVLAVPLILYSVGFREFLSTISFIGSVFLALEGVFVVWIWRSAFPKNPFRKWSILLYVVFLTAVIYEAVSFFSAYLR